MFRELTSEEERKFRKWARDNYVPLSEIQGIWHPVVQDECVKINKEEQIMKSSKTVIDQTCSAYIDSNPKLDWDTASRLRNLSFRASQPVSVAEAVKIMTKALHLNSASEQGYNNFAPALLKKLPLGSQVTLAREGSVCVYVKLPEGVEVNLESMRVKLDADECDLEGGEVRVWWD